MNVGNIILVKMVIGLGLIIVGVIFIALGGLGIINFIPATIEINGVARLVDTSPGIFLVMVGYLLIKDIKVIERRGDQIVLGFRKK